MLTFGFRRSRYDTPVLYVLLGHAFVVAVVAVSFQIQRNQQTRYHQIVFP